jgi:NosR/NirI family transcriptional regulator, nitrous oxide reductase regulator
MNHLAIFLLRVMFLIFLSGSLVMNALAGTLTKGELDTLFVAPLMVGEKDAKLPVWPIFQKMPTAVELVGWVFESIDLEPIRGYSGKPINLLVFMDQKGNFLDVRLREHKEPLFMSDKGTGVLAEFAAQYKGLSLQHSITMIRPKQPTHVADGIATVNGIAAGTVTAIAMERSIMESALKIAQSSLGGAVAGGVSARRVVRERFESMSPTELIKAGLVSQVSFTHGQAEEGFKATLASGFDDRPGQASDEAVIDFRIGLASLEQVGKNLFDTKNWETLDASKASGELTFVVLEKGRMLLAGNEKKNQAAAFRLRLKNPNKPSEWIEIKEVSAELTLPIDFMGTKGAKPRLFRTIGAKNIDLTASLNLAVQSTREVGFDPVRRFQSYLEFPYQPPNFVYWISAPPESRWKAAWRSRSFDLTVLLIGLAALSIALWRQKWLTAQANRLRNFRLVYLLFTLGFIGWWGQGQLTIVNLTALIESLRSGEGVDFLLADPMSLVLWMFVIASLFIWGRGTFCGWLCPFGALQDLIAQLGALVQIKQVSLRISIDAKLKWIKYVVLALILGSAAMSSAGTEQLIEIEPFKTAISLYFVRTWPYVLWAIACLVLSIFVFRGYCRYLCPLGAALAVFGKVRIFNWIPRKKECGTPCQTCRHSCNYQAITPKGKVDYAECFQCLDCVRIEQDDKRCLPLIQQVRSRVIPVHAVELVRVQ